MTYSEKLQKDIDEVYNNFPLVKIIIDEIKKIDDIPSMEFDISNEREWMKVKALCDILEVPK